VLRKYADDLDFVDVTATTVAGALRAAVADHPDLGIRLLDGDSRFHTHLLLFVDGDQVAREDQATTPVGPDTRIDVLISIVGGASGPT
jgi:hypothetical protein